MVESCNNSDNPGIRLRTVVVVLDTVSPTSISGSEVVADDAPSNTGSGVSVFSSLVEVPLSSSTVSAERIRESSSKESGV